MTVATVVEAASAICKSRLTAAEQFDLTDSANAFWMASWMTLIGCANSWSSVVPNISSEPNGCACAVFARDSCRSSGVGCCATGAVGSNCGDSLLVNWM